MDPYILAIHYGSVAEYPISNRICMAQITVLCQRVAFGTVIARIKYGSYMQNRICNRNYKENPKDLTEKSGVHP